MATASTGRSPMTSSSRSTARPRTRSASPAIPPRRSARRARRAYPMPAIPQTFLDKAYAQGARRHASTRCAPTPQGRTRSTATTGRPAAAMRAASRSARCRRNTTRPCMSTAAQKSGAAAACQDHGGRRSKSAPDRTRHRDPLQALGRQRGRGDGQGLRLAAHAIETPRLLLNSRSEATPNGVANSSDQVGRNLMDHPTQFSWALAPEPVWPYRGPLSTSGIENLRDGAFRKERPAFRIEIGNDGWSWPTGAPITTAADSRCRDCAARRSTTRCATRPRATSASPRWSSSCPTRRTA